MKKEKIEKILAEMRGSKCTNPFGPDVNVFKVMNKLFALVSKDPETPVVTLKGTPADCIVLTSQFESVVPGYHMNKKHWVTITLTGDVSDSMLLDLATKSYDLVVSNLSNSDKKVLENS